MKHSIVVCMGSSCFARGNKQILKAVEKFLAAHSEIECILSGQCCANKCKEGPNLMIDGEYFTAVDAESIPDLLLTKLKD